MHHSHEDDGGSVRSFYGDESIGGESEPELLGTPVSEAPPVVIERASSEAGSGRSQRSNASSRSRGQRQADANLEENPNLRTRSSKIIENEHDAAVYNKIMEHMDELEAKTTSSAGRLKALEDIQAILRDAVLSAEVLERARDSILEQLQRSLRRGAASEKVVAAQVFSLIAIQMGATLDSGQEGRFLKDFITLFKACKFILIIHK